jgi:hypothetical protein
MQVSRSGLKLHLSEHHGDASPGSTVFVWMQDVDAYRTELIGKGYAYSKPGIQEEGRAGACSKCRTRSETAPASARSGQESLKMRARVLHRKDERGQQAASVKKSAARGKKNL